uniref:Nudix hydrolase domain-containing protein n=1 Tax=Sinocyclocheilus rhinocerous TaxID=307959 RepID=A0A673L2Z1_9TELE
YTSQLLKGEGLEVTELYFAPEQKKPVTRKNTCFAVCALIFNSKVMSAKAVCRGLWYLPAGRMEDGDSIEEALKREVKEETGIDRKPITLLQIQEKGPSWIRFAFLAEKIGGSLKRPEDANANSQQYCMPSIYEQLSVNTCGILGVQHNGRIPGQTDGVCLNTLVLLEYKEEGGGNHSPPKPQNDGFRWHEVTNQSLRTEILQKIQEGSVLPVQSL